MKFVMGGQFGAIAYVAMAQDPRVDLVVAGSADTPPPPVNSRLELKCPGRPPCLGRPSRQQCPPLRFYVASTR